MKAIPEIYYFYSHRSLFPTLCSRQAGRSCFVVRCCSLMIIDGLCFKMAIISLMCKVCSVLVDMSVQMHKIMPVAIFPLEISMKMKQIAAMALGRRPHSLFYFRRVRLWGGIGFPRCLRSFKIEACSIGPRINWKENPAISGWDMVNRLC